MVESKMPDSVKEMIEEHASQVYAMFGYMTPNQFNELIMAISKGAFIAGQKDACRQMLIEIKNRNFIEGGV